LLNERSNEVKVPSSPKTPKEQLRELSRTFLMRLKADAGDKKIGAKMRVSFIVTPSNCM